MKVNVMTPFDTGKNLGKAYNQAMSRIGDDEWGCLIDHDILFLTPDAINILHGYVERYPDAGLLTCYTNRIHVSSPQLLNNKLADDTDILTHLEIAERRKSRLYEVVEIHKNVSGFLMLISKNTWKQIPFTEDKLCLGVDTDYWKRIKAHGMHIYIMSGLYCFHLYRLGKSIHDKSHLF